MAWRYVLYHRGKTIVLVLCITLVAALPLSLRILVDRSEEQLLARAAGSPLVVGARGSALDLVLNALYFGDQRPEEVTQAVAQRVEATGLAQAIPVYNRFRARGVPIVGTTLDYFDLRDLEIAQGRALAVLGDCVLGAGAADRLALAPGDTLVSSPENLFDLAGSYPVRMNVVGILAPTGSPDDVAVFVALRTAWIMAGLGHGHQDLAAVKDPTLVARREGGNVAATAKLREFSEIDPSTIGAFHFHGDAESFPLSAVIAVPHDHKSEVLLLGRGDTPEAPEQTVEPLGVVEGLVDDIFRIERLVEAGLAGIAAATGAIVVLVFVLSLRLRQREIETIYKLGCSRLMTAELLGAELAIVVSLVLVLTTGVVIGVNALGARFVSFLISF